ncbi:response regulator [Pelolinea submarina]|uniref:Response regulator receiver domain-containing protein n=1 Tax=Pelolinea submarina TaxID=913107 RepID=A0A347ZQX3_9CHLR|nr:response regulator [Pelolinea submarina]REG11742.1 response regulator receiver domain-containing protein [Pelolinea submarina]BBB47704.1 two-component system, cell cycle response regulator DivK [Pelolinea submarina]
MKSNILIIEDNEQNLYLVTFILEKYGYTVIPARNGQAGIDIAKENCPDLILLDIQLPIMNGYDVARELRKILGDAIPIIAITSYAMPGDREKALEAGCSDYITKPINPDTFMTNIEQYLSGPSSSGEKAA